jgi:hypothetical protein
VALNNRAAVLAGMPGPLVSVEGGTPMETGLKVAIDYLKTLDPAIPRAQIMVADGQVSTDCPGETFAEALAAVTDAYDNHDIVTYVVGIDASGTTHTQLVQLADAGGAPNPNGPYSYYLADDQQGLEDAMWEIINSTLSCVVPLNPLPPEPDNVEVWVDGVLIPEITDCATQDGWMYVPPTPPWDTIEFCGTACDDFRTAGEADILYYCTPG